MQVVKDSYDEKSMSLSPNIKIEGIHTSLSIPFISNNNEVIFTNKDNHKDLQTEQQYLTQLIEDLQNQLASCNKPTFLFKPNYLYMLLQYIEFSELYIFSNQLISRIQTESIAIGTNIPIHKHLGSKNTNFSAINHAITDITAKIIDISSNINIIVEEMETLTLIDINIKNPHNNLFSTLKEYIHMIVHIINVRCLGGQIIIDFPKLGFKELNYLLSLIKQSANTHRKDLKIYGFSRMKLLEISAPRTKISLHKALYKQCPNSDLYEKDIFYIINKILAATHYNSTILSITVKRHAIERLLSTLLNNIGLLTYVKIIIDETISEKYLMSA